MLNAEKIGIGLYGDAGAMKSFAYSARLVLSRRWTTGVPERWPWRMNARALDFSAPGRDFLEMVLDEIDTGRDVIPWTLNEELHPVRWVVRVKEQMIGINDVWRQFDSELNPDQVSVERYERVYRTLLERTRPALRGLVLGTPYFLELNRDEPMRKRMDAYGAVVARLAKDYDALFVDVQAAFDRYLAVQSNQTGRRSENNPV